MLDQERAYFSEHVTEWVKETPGRFVVVKGQTLLGTFVTLDDALAAGARRLGLQSFLVREPGVEPEEIRIPALALGILRADP